MLTDTPGEGPREPKSSMLPGIAMICLYLILITTLNVYAAMSGKYGAGRGKYGVLTICTLLALGIFGLLRLTKWGWALASAGCLLLALGYLVYFTQIHAGFFLVQGLLLLVFFLYLVRPEVRVRLH